VHSLRVHTIHSSEEGKKILRLIRESILGEEIICRTGGGNRERAERNGRKKSADADDEKKRVAGARGEEAALPLLKKRWGEVQKQGHQGGRDWVDTYVDWPRTKGKNPQFDRCECKKRERKGWTFPTYQDRSCYWGGRMDMTGGGEHSLNGN